MERSAIWELIPITQKADVLVEESFGRTRPVPAHDQVSILTEMRKFTIFLLYLSLPRLTLAEKSKNNEWGMACPPMKKVIAFTVDLSCTSLSRFFCLLCWTHQLQSIFLRLIWSEFSWTTGWHDSENTTNCRLPEYLELVNVNGMFSL